MLASKLLVKRLGVVDYTTTWQAMLDFTQQRDQHTHDELWVLQHPKVFTLGQASKPQHLLNTGDIPVVQTDRGGQVTYHAPGQLVIYPLVNLQRCGLDVRAFVSLIEKSIGEVLAEQFAVPSFTKKTAPGVYVKHAVLGEAKIASLGLRIKRGASYHGLSLNVAMDLEPFARINPCGYADMHMTQVSDLIAHSNTHSKPSKDVLMADIADKLVQKFIGALAYQEVEYLDMHNPAQLS